MNDMQPSEQKNTEPVHPSAGETSRRHIKRLWEIIKHHSGLDELTDRPSEKRVHVRPKRREKKPFILFLLQLVPLILTALFAFSFFWDFNGYSITIFGTVYPLTGILRIVTISGLIGFLTNWIAITMLFRPSHKRPILGHGLIPAHKDRIAFRLANAVSEDLINPEIIKQKIHESKVISRYREKSVTWLKTLIDDPSFRNDIKQWVIEYSEDVIADADLRANLARHVIQEVDEALVNRSLEKAAIRAYTFLRGKEMQDIIEDAIAEIPSSVEKGFDKLDLFLDELPAKLDQQGDAIEELITNLLYRLINQLDVHALVEDNLKTYDEARLETMIRGATNEQLRYIQYLGAVIGTVGGLVIWQPVISLSAICILLALIFALDYAIGIFK